MTKEQRLELLKEIEKNIYVPSIKSTFLDEAKSCAIHSVIEELEQESCEVEAAKLQQAYNKGFEDCRQAVLSYIYNDLGLGDEENGADIERQKELESSYRYVKSLPPVKPQPQTVLYSGDGYADGYMVYDMAECPNCGYKYEEGDKDWGL